ncbi:MAG: zf-HC2 domain-containing protein [Idiomarina sp.]|nr:zf-HC2 domain-containing protein [Idiomarina sp.]
MKPQTNTSNLCDEVAVQLSAYLDDELTQQQAQRIGLHLKQCASCNALYAELKAQRTDLKHALLETPETTELLQLEQEPGARGLAFIGWGLFIFAALLLAALFSWQFIASLLTASGLVFWIQLATALLYIGLFVLFLSVLRQRLIARKTDKYKKVKL